MRVKMLLLLDSFRILIIRKQIVLPLSCSSETLMAESEEANSTNRVREEEEEGMLVYRMQGVTILSCEAEEEEAEEEVPTNPNKKLKTTTPPSSSIKFQFHFHHHQRMKFVYRYLNMEETVVEDSTPYLTQYQPFQVPIQLSANHSARQRSISSFVSFMFQFMNAPSVDHDHAFIQGIVSSALSIINNTTTTSVSAAAMRIDLTTEKLFVADEYDIAVEATLQRSLMEADDRGYTTPASPTVVDALETGTYHHHSNSTTASSSSCSVCLDDIETGDQITYMPCAHYFHTDCIRGWLLKGDNCPNCRLKLLPP